MAEIRAHLPTGALTVPMPVSSWLLTGLGPGYAAAAGAGHVVAGTAAGVSPALAPLPRADAAPPGASGNGSAGLAHRPRLGMVLS